MRPVLRSALRRTRGPQVPQKGLDKTGRRIVGFLATHGIQNATVLEVGGGLGELEIELLKPGAARAVNLELSPAYEVEMKRLLSEQALEGRVEWRVHDIAADPDAVDPADIVLLHRVVCCYPDYGLLSDDHLVADRDRAAFEDVCSQPAAMDERTEQSRSREALQV
jgi:predicted RNA methylase